MVMLLCVWEVMVSLVFKNVVVCWDTYGILIAQSKITLSIALGDFDSVVNVVNCHCVIGDVLHTTRAASTLQIGGESRGNTRPDLDASTVLSLC